jgi:phage shock protein A
MAHDSEQQIKELREELARLATEVAEMRTRLARLEQERAENAAESLEPSF